jgi:hypothetical protein
MNLSHGMYNTYEYRVWHGMRQRCNNPNREDYAFYGAKGVSYDTRWDSFENFYEDMGPRPTSQHQLDRYPDCTGDYTKSNCRWVLRKEQNRNRRDNVWVILDGERMCLKDACDKVGINYAKAKSRANRWTLGRALEIEESRIYYG